MGRNINELVRNASGLEEKAADFDFCIFSLKERGVFLMPEDTDSKDFGNNETNCEIAGVVDYCKDFDGYMTRTTIDQEECEERCAAYLIPNDMLSQDELATRIKSGYFDEHGNICFMRDQHIQYCRKHLGTLGGAYMSQCSAYFSFFP